MAAVTITVSELKCACLDPDWRKRWLEGKRPSTQHFSPPGTPTVCGSTFHSLADKFTKWLASSTQSAEASALASPSQLWDQLYHRWAEPHLDQLASDDLIESAVFLSDALQAFCTQLSNLRKEMPHFRGWNDLLLTQEYRVRDAHFPFGDRSLFVSGQIDAVRMHPKRGFEIVDYKLSRGANLKYDLLQLAIYSRLMDADGAKFCGCLEYYLPQLDALNVSGEDLSGIFNDLVEPVMRELASHGALSTGDHSTRTSSAAPSGSGFAIKIEQCFRSFDLGVSVIAEQHAPQLIRYTAKPAEGVKVVSLANRAEDLQVALGIAQPPRIEPSAEGVTIDVPKNQPDMVHWHDVMNHSEWTRIESPTVFTVGIGVDGRPILADLSEATTCHGLVAGTSGSGKSEWLKSVVATLLKRNTPETLRLALVDPKMLTFTAVEGVPHLLQPIITDLNNALECLENAVEEMERRYRLLANERFANLRERRAAGRLDLPFHVLIFDEFADLILAGRSEKQRFEQLVARIAGKGRAAGIHLILATQRPDRQIVTGLIKANLPFKVCLRVTNGINSQIVLDEPGAERLLGCGDLLCDLGRGLRRAQSPLVGAEDFNRILTARHQDTTGHLI